MLAHLVSILCALLPITSAGAGIEAEYRSDKASGILPNIFGSRPRSFAILIGITEYKDGGGFQSLEEAKDDVNKMRTFLVEKAGFDFVLTLTEEKATKEKIESIMVDKMPAMLSAGDRFLFYWSGHGIARTLPNGRTSGYLPLRNSSKNAYGSMISMDDIARWDALLNAKQTLFVLDTCVSGLAGVQSKTSEVSLSLNQLDRPSHHLFAAGTSAEEAIVGPKWSGSLFTHSLIQAISATAGTGSPVVSLSDILVYVRRQIAFEKDRAGWSRSITPQLRQLQPSDGEFFFLVGTPSAVSTPSTKALRSQVERKGGESAGGPNEQTVSQVGTESLIGNPLGAVGREPDAAAVELVSKINLSIPSWPNVGWGRLTALGDPGKSLLFASPDELVLLNRDGTLKRRKPIPKELQLSTPSVEGHSVMLSADKANIYIVGRLGGWPGDHYILNFASDSLQLKNKTKLLEVDYVRNILAVTSEGIYLNTNGGPRFVRHQDLSSKSIRPTDPSAGKSTNRYFKCFDAHEGLLRTDNHINPESFSVREKRKMHPDVKGTLFADEIGQCREFKPAIDADSRYISDVIWLDGGRKRVILSSERKAISEENITHFINLDGPLSQEIYASQAKRNSEHLQIASRSEDATEFVMLSMKTTGVNGEWSPLGAEIRYYRLH